MCIIIIEKRWGYGTNKCKNWWWCKKTSRFSFKWTGPFYVGSNKYLPKKIGKEYRIPFELNVDPFYKEKNLTYLEKSFEDYKKGKLKMISHDIIEEADED